MARSDDTITPQSLRLKAGLTQQQVATALGVRKETISEWERGVYSPNLTFTDAYKLVTLYQCSLLEAAIAFDRLSDEAVERLTQQDF